MPGGMMIGQSAQPPQMKGHHPDGSGSSSQIALIDIGSNSVRLAVYKDYGHYPFPILNERVSCKLGEGLDEAGELQPKRIRQTLEVMRRFGALLKAINPGLVFIAATAAVRRAVNRDEFVIPAETILGQPINILPASEEARLITLGMMRNMPEIDGLVADLGGGSIELVHVEAGRMKDAVSLNIGHLSQLRPKNIKQLIADVSWLQDARGKPLYGIGGSFRAVGSAFMTRTSYPLFLLHGLTIDADDALKLTSKLKKQEADLTGIPAGRQSTIRQAATIIKAVMSTSEVSQLVVSGTSIRDGLMVDLLPDMHRNGDALLDACRNIARQSQRQDGLSEAIAHLLRPIALHFASTELAPIDGDTAQLLRMVEAASLLSDICWNESSDRRGPLAAEKILALPVFSLTHTQRAWLAKAVFHRYAGIKQNRTAKLKSDSLLTRRERVSARTVGLGMRFAQIFSGGVAEFLDLLHLSVEGDRLCCTLPAHQAGLMDEHSKRRLSVFAESCRLKADIRAL